MVEIRHDGNCNSPRTPTFQRKSNGNGNSPMMKPLMNNYQSSTSTGTVHTTSSPLRFPTTLIRSKGRKIQFAWILTLLTLLSGTALILWQFHTTITTDTTTITSLSTEPTELTRMNTSLENTPETNVGIVEELYEYVSAKRLQQIAKQHKESYANARPFPHMVIDGIFPQRFLNAVSKEMSEEKLNNGCINPNKCWKNTNQNLKSFINDENDMGIYTRILFGFLKSSTFVSFLEDITGIGHIIPDPHYRGSGLHFTASGGSLDIHADFNKYNEQINLDRRVNTFIYMNDEWPENYGGHLELWSRDMKSCYQKIAPTFGRFVVFSSTDFSYHGHPQPQSSPEGRVRRSIALYYYTMGRPSHECLDGDCSGKQHTTLFQKPVGCKVCEEDICKRFDDNASSLIRTNK